MLITGGGAYHDFLIERIQFYKPEIQITIPDTTLLEYKEALIFGLLGVLKLRNEINVLSSVTGAKKDHSAGKIYSKSV
jgi:anhydro-N-acetylmuramic acid kinase